MSTVGMRTSEPARTTARTVAQAKVNLYLRMLARETSGYHQLETLFCRLDIGDDVVVRTNVRGRSLECSGPALPAGGLGPVERNLAWRAASAYAAATGWPNDWSIEIAKHIPVGGGLGGGSSDAGAVLRCLNALTPTPISPDALLAVASPLGADVPFLSAEMPLALGWGRGERLLALPPLPGRDVALVCFPFGVSTPDAYRWFDEDAGDATPEASLLGLEQLGSWDGVSQLAHNDFETVVASRFPEIAESLEALRAFAGTSEDLAAIALVAGSGSTVCLVSDFAANAPQPGGSGRVLQTRTATRVVGVEVSD